MTLLQVIFIIAGFVILILGFDIAKRQKFSFLHIFIFIAAALLLFSIFPSTLDFLGKIFGVQRGADVLVYLSIVFLLYFVLFLLNKIEKNRQDLTKLTRQLAILEYKYRNKG